MHALYGHALDIDPTTLESILALPRESALADLILVLEDAVARMPHFKERCLAEEYECLYFPLHALMLLGEFDAREALPDILSFLEIHPDSLAVYLDDSWQILETGQLFNVFSADPSACLAWMKKPAIDEGPKTLLCHAMGIRWERDVDSRAELRPWFGDVLRSQLEADEDGQLLDTVLVANVVNAVCGLQIKELMPLIAGLYEKSRVSSLFMPSLQHAEENMNRDSPGEDFKSGSVMEVYREALICEEGAASGDDFDHDLEGDESALPAFGSADSLATLLPEKKRAPASDFPVAQAVSRKGTPRNAPCPCGSGKKYKRCCME